jgi:elongation of very long chain fatty acids protein 4
MNASDAAALLYPTDALSFKAAYPSYALNSPAVVVGSFLSYGLACGAARTLWSDRKAIAVPRALLVLYNAAQVMLSATICFGTLLSARAAGYSFFGNRIFDAQRAALAGEQGVMFFIRLFTLSKYVDLLDSLFLILAKRDRQLSFLHCSHHALVPIAVWYGMWHSPNGDSYVPCLVNSFVHTIMYSYYLLTTLGLRCPWKRWLTTVQLAQFAFLLVFGAAGWLAGSLAPQTVAANTAVQLAMLVMFSQFYAREYKARDKSE